jgi:anaerobic selenocysteine-containing dehydrogenase
VANGAVHGRGEPTVAAESPVADAAEPIGDGAHAAELVSGADLAAAAEQAAGDDAGDVPPAPPAPPIFLRPPVPSDATATAGPTPDGALRLVARRALWDAGTGVQHSPSLAHLPAPAAVAVHPDDLARLGVSEGSRVRVTAASGHLDLPVRADAGLVPGAASVMFNLPGASAATLIDGSAAVTTVRLVAIDGDGGSHG